MSSLYILSALVLTALVATVFILHRARPTLRKRYWLVVAVTSSTILILLSAIAWLNVYVYVFISFILLMSVREGSKYIFSPKYGSLVLGSYFGLWVSLPFGALWFST